MAENVKRVIVDTIVKKAIRDLKTDPDRTIRNLIDMALQFADSRFQKQFYSRAQDILSNENSGYYTLFRDTLTVVDEETLRTFSMNLGYNGLYQAAIRIREQEAQKGYNIPWTISLTIAEGKLVDQHYRTVAQGEALGVHSWHLFSLRGIHECLTLAANYPNSAFVIFCGPGEIDWSVIDCVCDLKNVALILPFDADADMTCSLLQLAGVLYGLSYSYTAKDLKQIESGALVQDMEQLNPAFAILQPRSLSEQSLRDRVYQWISTARMGQGYHTILWELYGDMLLIDEIISDNPCWVGFDEHGQLNTEKGVNRTHGLNIYKNDLEFILRQAFPKPTKENDPYSI